jgi:hypothetical protein
MPSSGLKIKSPSHLMAGVRAGVADGVHPQRVDIHIEPETHGFQCLLHHDGVIEVEVGLVRKKAMPVEGLGRLIPGSIGLFRVGEDDVGVLVELIGLGPDVHFACH